MRTKSSLINIIASILQIFLPSIILFISRTVFISVLGLTFLGLNSLFTDLFILLSLMELGVGSAMTYFLYEPLATNDNEKIKQLMNLYGRLYHGIGVAMGLVGLLLIPFLDDIINTTVAIDNIELFYVLMLLNLISTYFFSHKRAIYTADQKNYMNSLNELVFHFVRHSVQIVVLMTTGSYTLYLIVAVIITLASNLAISHKANRDYPYLTEPVTEKLSRAEIKHIFSRVSALFAHNLGTVVVFGTDNLMMSLFGNIQFVGLYANYTIIIGAFNSLINAVFNNIVASVGNLSITEGHEKAYEIFQKANFVNYLMIAFTAICLFHLFNPFITVWLGEDFLIPQSIVLVIVINYYLSGMRQVALSFTNAKGFFWDTRYKPVLEAGIDLIFAVILGYNYGPPGILIATMISFAATVWVDPYVLYTKWFQVRPSVYFIDYGKKVLLTVAIGTVVYFVREFVIGQTDSILILFAAVSLATLILLLLIFYRTDEFRYLWDTVLVLVKNIRK